MEIVALGSSLIKLFTISKGDVFNKSFTIPRPHTPVESIEDLKRLHSQLVVLQWTENSKILLRGQFEYLNETNEVLFVGSPCFGSMEQVMENKLMIDDFAHHDPLIDFLHVLKSQEITNNDLKELIGTISQQKSDLKKANKEIHDIALFPMQNPDPLIRINFEGDLLTNNPAAASLDFINYNNTLYRNDDFFKLVAEQFDRTKNRWTIEAKSGEIEYSFFCVQMPQEGYINIYGRDITQQKADQQQIEHLSLVASANENGVVFTNEKGKIIWCNCGIEKITGYTQNEIIGKTPIELLRGPLTDKEGIRSMVENFSNFQSFQNELIHYRKDGSWYWGKTKGQSVITADGKMSYFAIIEDATTAKNKEEQLIVLSSIAAENTHGVVIADAEGKVEWLNKGFENITGYNLDEMKGKKPGHVLQGPETDKETVAYIKTQIEKGDPFICEILNYHKNGSAYWLRLQGQSLKDNNGKIIKFFAIGEDITREKQINQQLLEFESRFRMALERIGDNVWEHNFRTGITKFSKQNNKFLKLELGNEDKIDEIWWNSVHKDDLAKLVENDKRCRNGEIDYHSMEYRLVQPDGNIIWVLDRGVVLEKDSNGKPLLIIGTHTDITSQKSIEQQLVIAKNSAEASKKTKELFLANMSHEIRTPMNAILGMGNQLKKSNLTTQQRFHLDTMNTAAENLLVIINDILDLSKIEAGKLTVEKIGFEPKNVVGKAIQVLLHKAEEKGLTLSNSFCDRRLSDVLIGDPYRINQVLLNLISNAIKFTEQGTVDITCKVIEEIEGKQTVKVSVIDTGIGMEKEYVDKLFDNFSQEYESISRKYGGTGLGMSICKELIQLMDGEINVISKKGVGTTVSFTIPFETGTRADLLEQHELKINPDFMQDKTILVTDDNEMNRLVAATILEQYGAAIVEAKNGEEAISVIKGNKIDLVLMDISMPVLNGYEATKALRKYGIKTPVIALTANAIRGENEKCLDAGMNDYITKPFKEDIFLKKIAYWLNITDRNTTDKEKDTDKTEQLYDLSALNDIGKGNSAFINKMINLFCDQTPGTIEQMKEAFENGQLETMGALAHKIKPSIDNLKIKSLREVIREIEQAGKENKMTEKLKQQIALTETTIQEVVRQLRKN